MLARRESGRNLLNQTASRRIDDARVPSIALAAGVLASGPVLAQDFARQRALNALDDIAASQRQQTEIMRQRAQRDSERAWREENARVNAQRDARSAQRFDRH